MSADTTANGLYRFNSGDWTLDYSTMVQMRGHGEPYEGACPFYLVEHDDGTVLFDTGVSYEMATDPESYGQHGAPHMVEFVKTLDIDESRTPTALLDDAGYEPGDVDYVVMSHLHTDHAGNIDAFPDAEFLVHEDELRYAMWPTAPSQAAFYLDGDLEALRSPQYDVTAVSGRYDLFDDGSIEVVPTPGHSPGHQSMVVELEDEGTVILGGDVANLQAGFEQNLPASFTWSLDDAVESMQKIRQEREASDADLYLHHDRDDQSRFPDPPAKLT